ncbi:hypothetical protein ACHAC9_10290 [Massilia sp. CMS3.1]|uniref:hypothetical protein n=1 Tax=Massilia sp. CMS3.1 TaxID=3373083 RepID=UPI003EE6188C
MTNVSSPRSLLLAPLLHLTALVLLAEEWLWRLGSRFAAFLASWPPLQSLEDAVRRLPSYAALLVFALPGLLLMPVKLLALLAMAQGHLLWGGSVFVLAKVGGAVIVARIYVLTLPSLLALVWFARWHNRIIMLKNQLIVYLRASPAYTGLRRSLASMRRLLRRMRYQLRPSVPFGSRHATRSARALRRFVSLWRRGRKPTADE